MKVSELFYSCQNEGHTNGCPAVFIRLQGCNLLCGINTHVQGDPEAKSSWLCDTIDVWRKGVDTTNEEVWAQIKERGEEIGVPNLQEWILDGTVHIIWTGGEPTLKRNRGDIIEFIAWLDEKYPGNKSFHELETNGTIVCPVIREENVVSNEFVNLYGSEATLYCLMDQINCSPKLANSGMKAAARIVPEAIEQIKAHRNHWWKFVVDCTNEETALQDWEEIKRDYVEPFSLDKRQVILMPGVDKREDLPEVTRVLFEVAKKIGIRAVTRGHILAWDACTGV